MKSLPILIFFYLGIFFISCDNNAEVVMNHKLDSVPKKMDKTNPIDTEYAFQNNKSNSILSTSCYESIEFLNINIEKFENCTFSLDSLNDSKYYKSLLLNNSVFNYLPYDFDSGYFEFRKFKKVIFNYGTCEIGVFKYSDLTGSRQSRDYLLLNQKKHEMYFFHYDKIIFDENELILYFNCRGNLSVDTVLYSRINNNFMPKCSI